MCDSTDSLIDRLTAERDKAREDAANRKVQAAFHMAEARDLRLAARKHEGALVDYERAARDIARAIWEEEQDALSLISKWQGSRRMRESIRARVVGLQRARFIANTLHGSQS